jgi:hypothetical protein
MKKMNEKKMKNMKMKEKKMKNLKEKMKNCDFLLHRIGIVKTI